MPFFDVDSLKNITKSALANHVKKSACLIIILNDETLSSEWVQLEITTALKNKIPIVPLINQEGELRSDGGGGDEMRDEDESLEVKDFLTRLCTMYIHGSVPHQGCHGKVVESWIQF